MKRLLLTTAAALSVAGAADASITPAISNIFDRGNGQHEIVYALTVSANTTLAPGSKIVIYDFGGYVDGSVYAWNSVPFREPFDASVELLSSTDVLAGGVQANALFQDDPDIPNLVFTYNGLNPLAASDPYTMSYFSAFTTAQNLGPDGYSARDVHNYDLVAGEDEFNNGTVLVPIGDCAAACGSIPGQSTPCVAGVVCRAPPPTDPGCQADAPCDVHGGVPEPATWSLMIAGFGGVGALLRRRRLTGLAA